MILEENWAVDPGRVGEFFAALEGSIRTPSGFLLNGCSVTVTPAESSLLGRWTIRRSIVRFEGEEDDVKALYRQFFLTFLSAGG